MVVKIKPSKRGGVRERLKNKPSTSRLLEALWNRWGGPVATGEVLKKHYSLLLSWRIRGKVPIKLVPYVSATLKVPMHGLNYLDIIKFYGYIPWEEVVKSYKFSVQETAWILKGRRPKEP